MGRYGARVRISGFEGVGTFYVDCLGYVSFKAVFPDK